jgi:hypothetical protein
MHSDVCLMEVFGGLSRCLRSVLTEQIGQLRRILSRTPKLTCCRKPHRGGRCRQSGARLVSQIPAVISLPGRCLPSDPGRREGPTQHVQPQEAPVASDHDVLAPGMLCIHGIAPHAAEQGIALPPTAPLPLVPEVLADIVLKRLLCWGA